MTRENLCATFRAFSDHRNRMEECVNRLFLIHNLSPIVQDCFLRNRKRERQFNLNVTEDAPYITVSGWFQVTFSYFPYFYGRSVRRPPGLLNQTSEGARREQAGALRTRNTLFI